MDGTAGNPRVIELPEAARLLGLSEEGVTALVGAGYLRSTDGDAARFALGDVKAFLARLADSGVADIFSEDRDSVDPQALLDALDGRSEEMARRAFDIFQHGFPEAADWSLKDRHHFIEQAQRRFEAILAITEHGEDDELVGELRQVGAAAAWSGSSLPQLLVVLRISRDLVVQTAVEVGRLTEPLCGRVRPGHFRGVTTVVTKLFHCVRPHLAVFGEKDFQQLAVVRRMTADLDFGIEIVGVPTVREADGLALSSRNRRLGPADREAARCVPRALAAAAAAVAAGEVRPAAILARTRAEIAAEPRARLEYAELRDPDTLEEVAEVAAPALLALVVWVGGVRLIDNRLLVPGGEDR